MKLDRTFVVNLLRRPDNKRKMATRIAEAGFAGVIDYFRAVDGLELGPAYLEAHGFAVYPDWPQAGSANAYHRRALKLGELGCALSHAILWQRIVDEDLDCALVLEDDAVFTTGAAAVLARRLAALTEADPAWDLCYVGRVRPRVDPRSSEPEQSIAVGLVIPTFSYCTHAYVVSRSGARKLVDSALQRAIIPVDEHLPALYCDHPRADIRALVAGAPRLRAYAIEPGLARQAGGDSDIEASPSLAASWTPTGTDDRWARWSSGERVMVAGESLLRVETPDEVIELPVDEQIATLLGWMVERDRFAVGEAARASGFARDSVEAVVGYLETIGLLAVA